MHIYFHSVSTTISTEIEKMKKLYNRKWTSFMRQPHTIIILHHSQCYSRKVIEGAEAAIFAEEGENM